MKTTAEIRANIHRLPLATPMLGYILKIDEEVILVFNPSLKQQSISIPAGDWAVLADHESAGVSTKRAVLGGKIMLEPVSINVLLKK
jgi:pullulanase